jgi:hypothetical protein
MPKRAFALAMLNYTLDDDFIIPFLDGLCHSGYEGICLHPRDGLLVPYASRFYWERINRIIGLARERGMEVWHYDEFPFPSGSAGGMIPEQYPASHARVLQFEEIANTPNEQGAIEIGRGSLLALLRYREGEDGAPRDWRDVTADVGSLLDTWSWGEWHNLFYTGTSRVREEPHERGSTDRFVLAYKPLEELGDDKLLAIKIGRLPQRKHQAGQPDVTLPEVTDLFLEKIYSRFSALSSQHGLAATPVFQDEVTFYSPFPWNREIEARLRPLWGDKLSLKLAALWKPGAPGWELARYEYRAACQNAFEVNWCARVAAYCRAHGLRMSGHLPGEESIFMHSQLTGDIFKALSHFDIPGYDIISSHLPDDENRSHAAGAKIVQSSAWLEGRKPAMVEVFGAHGFHNDLQKNRATLAWMTAQDITLTFDHSAYSSALGVRKYDAPPVHNRFNPLHVARADLWQWNNWLADLLDEYAFDPETLVLFPADAMARYHASEQERWKEQTALIETWFHYACAHSLDCIFVPSHLLSEIEAVADGFKLRGQVFKNFLVPPVASLHETTWDALASLAPRPGFLWSLPAGQKGVTVFGPQTPGGEERVVQAHAVKNCSEEQLVKEKAGWFDAAVSSRVAAWQTPRTLLKSLRRHRRDGSHLLLLINPEDEPLEVRSTLPPGHSVPQPPNNVTSGGVERDGDDYRITLAPRDTVLFRLDDKAASQSTPASEMATLRPHDLAYRFAAPNRQSLQHGTATLEGQAPVAFRPARFSSLWPLPIEYEESVVIYAEPHSLAPLPAPAAFEVTFPVVLNEPLPELRVLMDFVSLPPQTEVCWDETPLKSQTEAVIDALDTTFAVPAAQLSAGAHTLRFRGTAHNGGDGVVERPILIGRFLVEEGDGGAPLALRAMPDDWQSLEKIKTWPQLGMPEGYGPVEYRMSFEAGAEEDGGDWELQLPECIGVAEVAVNDQNVGRSSWEPRRLPLPAGVLRAGENRVQITLHGSWNNVFSALNRLENGLTGEPVLERL